MTVNTWILFFVAVSVSAWGQKTYLNADGSKPVGFSQVVSSPSGKMVYTSGQVPWLENGQMADPTDFEAQAVQVHLQLQKALKAAGADMTDVVKVTLYIVDYSPDKLEILRKVRARFFHPDHPPATTLLGVEKLFRDDVLIEIDAVAIVNTD